MKKIVLSLLVTLLFSVGLVAFLFYYTTQKSFLNNFVRKIRPHALGPSKFLDLKYASFYYAGASDKRIYLGNGRAPLYVFTSDPEMSDTLLMKMNPTQDSMSLLMARIGIARNKIYLFDGATPAIYSSTAKQGASLHTIANNKIFFTEAVPLSPTSFALRIYDRISHQYMLAREIPADSTPLKPAPGILQKQIDGIFCTDGSLLYDSATARLIYVYRYRNEFICMDTSLNILYRAHTIDTISRARIKVDTIKSNSAITLKTPSNVTNRMVCMDSHWLFVNSTLLADNEDPHAIENASAIDVYRVDNGEYQFSFYLPDLEDERISSIGAAHGKLYVLYGHNLLAYTLNPTHFKTQELVSTKSEKPTLQSKR